MADTPFPEINWDFDDTSPRPTKKVKTMEEELAECYSALSVEFPRILEKISATWGHPECDKYLSDLVIDKRGDRQGFPPRVMAAILKLSSIHSATFGTFGHQGDGWATTNFK